MFSAILIWASLALLAAAISVLVTAFISSARASSQSRQAGVSDDTVVSDSSVRATLQSPSWPTPLAHRAPVSSAYGQVVSATHQYVIEESTYVDLKAEIVEAFARLELALDSSVGYHDVSNFESEPRMELRVA